MGELLREQLLTSPLRSREELNQGVRTPPQKATSAPHLPSAVSPRRAPVPRRPQVTCEEMAAGNAPCALQGGFASTSFQGSRMQSARRIEALDADTSGETQPLPSSSDSSAW